MADCKRDYDGLQVVVAKMNEGNRANGEKATGIRKEFDEGYARERSAVDERIAVLVARVNHAEQLIREDEAIGYPRAAGA